MNILSRLFRRRPVSVAPPVVTFADRQRQRLIDAKLAVELAEAMRRRAEANNKPTKRGSKR